MTGLFSNILNWRPKSAAEAEKVTEEAETAERSIEERMENVTAKLKRRGYAALDQTELDELAKDLAKILEFVEHALAILEGSTRINGIDASLRRLKYVKTRVEKLRAMRDNFVRAA